MYKHHLLFFLFVGLPLVAIAQELSYNHYTVHDGLAQMQVEDLLLDSHGALWVATRGGVSKFNGYTFDSFEDLDSRPTSAFELGQDSDGNIVVLSAQGLYFFDGLEFIFYPAPDGTKYNHESRMVVDNEDRVFCIQSNSHKLNIFSDSTFLDFSVLQPKLNDVKIAAVGLHQQTKSLLFRIYEGGEFLSEGVYVLKKDQIVPLMKTKEPVVFHQTYLKGSSKNQDFIIKVIDREWKYFLIDKTATELDYKFTVLDNAISDMHTPPNDELIYVGYYSKDLVQVSKNFQNLRILIKDLTTRFNYPGKAYLDDHSNIYIETDKGLVIINANKFEKHDEQDLPNIWSIAEDKNGEIIFGGYGVGLKKLGIDDRIEAVPVKDEQYCNKFSLKEKARFIYMGATTGLDGNLIYPFEHGLLKMINNRVELFDNNENCKGTMASLFVFTDRINQRVLSATCQGLRILDKNGNLLRVVKDGLFDHRCLLTINKDLEGKYWVGATGGIAYYDFDSEEIKNYTQENEGFPYNGVVCTFIDYKGTLWAGSREGLTFHDKGKDKFVALKGFEGVEVASMITSEDSQLFLSTAGALIEANLESFYKDGKMLHRVYDKNNGLGIIGSGQNGFFKDADGKIWCTSDTGVYRFDPQNLKSNINIPAPNVVSINGQRISSSTSESGINIPEGTNNLSIEYESIGLNASNNLKYSYLLEGYDDDWSPFAKYNNCTYNNLGSGDYTFKVKNSQSEQISQHKISVDIPLHKEPSFGGIAGIASVSFLFVSLLLGLNWKLARENNDLLKIQEQQLKTDKKNLEELNRLGEENKVLLEEQNRELIFQKSELEGLNYKLQNEILDIRNRQTNTVQKLEIKTKGKINYINYKDLLYIQAEENGCRYFLKDNSTLWNDEKLKSWEESLDPELFIRIHRSTLIQKEHVTAISYDKLKLSNGTELKIGRKYKDNL